MAASIKAFSFGCGVDSMAALVLAARGEIDYNLFLFSNVGDDSEYPATLLYYRSVALPYAFKNGLELRQLKYMRRNGKADTLYSALLRKNRSVPIPVRMSNGAPGNRACTVDFKIKVVRRELRRLGATADNPAVVGVGIAVDEWSRARSSSGFDDQILDYPLIDLRLTRAQCVTIIADAGLPVPPKSSCWFCPFHRQGEWLNMYRDEPELFERACQLEDLLNKRRETLGRDQVYLSSLARPLSTLAAAGHIQNDMFGDEHEGYSCAPFACSVGL